ncbi:hypothetical protein ACFL6I_10875 [candidate division KSB1 bacterium]
MSFLHSNNQRGTSLLDVIFGASILLVVFIGLFGAFKLSLEIVQSVKGRTGALALASERVEYVRSLLYDDIGTVGGIPQGVLVESETETLNGVSYTRRTFVQYTDATQDGSGGSDTNSITTDYKTVKVTVEWAFRNETRSISLVTTIVPKGIESIIGGGTLRITVLDALGLAVPSAQVSLINSQTSPAISLSTFTNTSGIVEFLGAPAANSYEVSIIKTGYSSAQTYDVDISNTNPNPGHLTVSESNTTSSSFSIDVTGSIVVNTFEVGTTTPLPSIPFSIRGDKTIGLDSGSNDIYKYNSSINTGASGSVTTSSLEWDNYTISIDDGATGYDIAESCSTQPISLDPSGNEIVNIYLADDVAHSLLVNVKDINGNLLSGASIQLYRGGYDTTQYTSTCGQTFFNNSLSQGTVGGGNSYTIYVSLSGYSAQTISSVEVDGASEWSVILVGV